MWKTLSEYAKQLGVSKLMIIETKKDYDKLLEKYSKIRRSVSLKYSSKNLDTSFSMQNFYPWFQNIFCFFQLIMSGFRHVALRELRFLLEASVRAYYIDTHFPEKEYKSRVSKLKIFKKKSFAKLIVSLPLDKQKELHGFYTELCDYVHLSEMIQTDALGDFSLNLALGHPYYKEDVRMLKKTLGLSQYLLMKSMEEN